MWTKILSITVLIVYTAMGQAAGNDTIKNFDRAKRWAYDIHQEHPYTIYCGCKYEKKVIDLDSCGYVVHTSAKRASRLEWEHVVPAETFGQSFVEWREGAPQCKSKNGEPYKGRRCAQKNPVYALIEADLYNLWPEVGELNGLRVNYSMAALGPPQGPEDGLSFGGCKAYIRDHKFEPMDIAKGIVARTYLYMENSYPGRGIISDKNQKLFEAWNKMFPVTPWECHRAQKIQAIQGNVNTILQPLCTPGALVQ